MIHALHHPRADLAAVHAGVSQTKGGQALQFHRSGFRASQTSGAAAHLQQESQAGFVGRGSPVKRYPLSQHVCGKMTIHPPQQHFVSFCNHDFASVSLIAGALKPFCHVSQN